MNSIKLILVNQFQEIISNDGLSKIFQSVRNLLSKSSTSFLKENNRRFRAFIEGESINSEYLPRIWNHLQSMTCKHVCPWCGVPCCGLKTCNDLYEPNQLPSVEHAKVKHSCQFHRDTTITGTHTVRNYIDESQPGEILDTLPNYGACPERIRLNRQILFLEPNSTKVCLQDYLY